MKKSFLLLIISLLPLTNYAVSKGTKIPLCSKRKHYKAARIGEKCAYSVYSQNILNLVLKNKDAFDKLMENRFIYRVTKERVAHQEGDLQIIEEFKFYAKTCAVFSSNCSNEAILTIRRGWDSNATQEQNRNIFRYEILEI